MSAVPMLPSLPQRRRSRRLALFDRQLDDEAVTAASSLATLVSSNFLAIEDHGAGDFPDCLVMASGKINLFRRWICAFQDSINLRVGGIREPPVQQNLVLAQCMPTGIHLLRPQKVLAEGSIHETSWRNEVVDRGDDV